MTPERRRIKAWSAGRFRQLLSAALVGAMLILPVCPGLLNTALTKFVLPPLWAATAKAQYLNADDCLKKLKRSTSERQKVSSWLTCINRYEAIYTAHPDDPWAPAGMYKAAELYLQLHRLSRDPIYRARGEDLIARIKNKYPKSAYNGRAKSLSEKLTTDDPRDDTVKRLTSRKSQTRDKETREADPSPADVEAPPDREEAEPPKNTPPLPDGDTRVTDLRFWSNPEYTRIVVNADAERPYSHRLLEKDPQINQPFQRLYIDIEQARLGENVAAHTPINDDLLSQARAGQYQTHTVRVVVDIKSFENYKIFTLKDPFRIIIDVWGQGGKAGDEAVRSTQQPPAGGTTPKGADAPVRITTDNLKSSDIARQLALGVRTIVIDPGHGGKDPGAPGYTQGVWEKDIALKLALTLAEKLRQRLNCTVLLTRDKDKKLTLEERTAIANTKRADLFISLHCNAARNKDLAGIETYILNLATDDQAIAVAARENATSRKNISDLEYILSDLMKHAKIEESSRLANDVHTALVKGIQKRYSHITDLGVKQAPFYVLLGARMPSILVETSFISNKRECKRLMTKAYQDDISTAITDGIERYINATNPKQIKP